LKPGFKSNIKNHGRRLHAFDGDQCLKSHACYQARRSEW
jgi:hypothetical protein